MTDSETPTVGRLDRLDGENIAYVRTPGRAPGVVFLGGFMSDMTGTKATALEAMCRNRGQAFVRFDYQGHGQSSGRFADGTIGRWADDAIAIVDALTEGPQVLVGSSMGGWIMLLVARARPQRLHGLVGIAPAPDFTRRMMAEELSTAQRQALARDGQIELPSEYDDGPYVITHALIDDGNQHAMMDTEIPIHCPVRILHGMKDTAVPWQTALRLSNALAGRDVTVTLVKHGDHRLSEPDDIARLEATVTALL